MSGPESPRTIQITGPEAGTVERLLTTLARVLPVLEEAGRAPIVIGGLAVMARVAVADRATQDADTAAHVVDGPPSVELVEAAKLGEKVSESRVQVGDVVVDCIDTEPIGDADLASSPAAEALFVGAHRFAYEGAEAVVLRAGDTELACRVARPSGLLATKSHAATHRREAEKIGSDVFDLRGLVIACDPRGIAGDLAAWPNLARLVRDALALSLIRDAVRNARHLSSGSAAMAALTEEDLLIAGETMCPLLDEALKVS